MKPTDEQVEAGANAVRRSIQLGKNVGVPPNVYEIAQACLTAALADVVAPQWRDITTAPKDGTIISLWHKVWKCSVAARYLKGRSSGCKWVEATLTTEWPDDAFTHWQPLPAPPVSP